MMGDFELAIALPNDEREARRRDEAEPEKGRRGAGALDSILGAGSAMSAMSTS